MTAYDFVLLTLEAFGREIQGKTLLQKRCYFVGLLSGQLDEMKFQAHYYGPYSAEIDGALGQLRALGFVSESRSGFGVVGGRGFEVSRYDYRLTEDGQKIAALRKTHRPADWDAVSQAVQRIKDAGDPEYLELSIAAKTYFLLASKGGPANERELIELAQHFGWQIGEPQMRTAWDFLCKLGVAKTVRMPQ